MLASNQPAPMRLLVTIGLSMRRNTLAWVTGFLLFSFLLVDLIDVSARRKSADPSQHHFFLTSWLIRGPSWACGVLSGVSILGVLIEVVVMYRELMQLGRRDTLRTLAPVFATCTVVGYGWALSWVFGVKISLNQLKNSPGGALLSWLCTFVFFLLVQFSIYKYVFRDYLIKDKILLTAQLNGEDTERGVPHSVYLRAKTQSVQMMSRLLQEDIQNGENAEVLELRQQVRELKAAAAAAAKNGAGAGAGAAGGGCEQSPLAGVTVVELGGAGVSVAAVGLQMAMLGATIIKVEVQAGGDAWRNTDPGLFAQFNRCKRSVCLAPGSVADQQGSIHKLVAKAHVLLSNLPLPQLEKLGLSPQAVRQSYPGLVYGLVTPWGLDYTQSSSNAAGLSPRAGDLGAFWAASSLCVAFSPAPPSPVWPPTLPKQLGELIASHYLYAGVASAVFHLKRCGEGQLVEVNMLNVGLWANCTLWSIYQKDPKKGDIPVNPAVHKRREQIPFCTASTYQTKDGKWFQMLGVDMIRHLDKTLGAFGIRAQVYPAVAYTLAVKCLPRRANSILEKFFPLFALLSNALEKEVRKLTWAECAVLFKKHDIWYAPVNMPAQAICNRAAHACGAFDFACTSSGDLDYFYVCSPTKLSCADSSNSRGGAPSAVPALGEANKDLL